MRPAKNCLNCYNNPYVREVICWNKEWRYEEHLRRYGDRHGQAAYEREWLRLCSVAPDETCGTYQQRNSGQPSLVFPPAIQLKLFNEL